MEHVRLNLNEKNRGSFTIDRDEERIGEMEVAVTPTNLIVYHTEVQPEYRGNGYAKIMFDAMVAYAREHRLTVVPLCQYVHAVLKHSPSLYKDIWQPEGSVNLGTE